MRTIRKFGLIAMSLLTSALCNAQNGNQGQSNESSSLKIEQISVSGNVYKIKATNKQDCSPVQIEWKWDKQTMKSMIPSSGVVIVDIVSDQPVKLTCKPLDKCGPKYDMGLVELQLVKAPLPVRFINFSIKERRTRI